MKAIAIAGTHSGVGKTTVTLALAAAARCRGLRVRAFKVGPDFIDASHLAAVTGQPCLSLDSWMFDRGTNQRRLRAHADQTDVALVEGVMGLFDGRSGDQEEGSTAQLAKWLGLPVILVADAAGAARSLAATVLGFRRFDPDLNVAGVVFNRVGGPGHVAYLRAAMPDQPVAWVGAAPADDEVRIQERHLGLTMPGELTAAPSVRALADWAEKHLDLDALLSLAVEPIADAAPMPGEVPPFTAALRLGVARDEAFCFYYPDNLELLRQAGIETVEFSPLRDANLPAEVDGLYFGGGYPELHAATLAANAGMRDAVRQFAAGGGFIYAECGGMMYLSRWLQTLDGQRHGMAGALDIAVEMTPKLAAIGYREVTPVGWAGGKSLRIRGHEFHHSRLAERGAATPPAHQVMGKSAEPTPEGFQMKNLTASYIHLHFASEPKVAALIAQRLLEARGEARAVLASLR